MKSLSQLIYSSFTVFFAPVLFPLFWLHPRGKRRLGERYGAWDELGVSEIVWFHGASLGEVQGLMPVIREWKEHSPHDFVLLTAVSPTGLDAATELCDAVRLLPFDHSVFFGALLDKYTVKRFIFGETELWPNLLLALSERKVPIHLVNGVLSEKSLKRYRLLSGLTQPALSTLTTAAVADESSRQRFIMLGLDPAKAIVTGNAKYDRPRSLEDDTERESFRREFFEGDAPVLTLGSIHPGEAGPWFSVLQECVAQDLALSVVVAPRHREKFTYFEKLLTEKEIPFEKRSERKSAAQNVAQSVQERKFHCILLDTLGELESVYAFSDLAFVGGTMIELGGHNPLEPVSYAVPIVVGTFTHKIEGLVSALREAGGVRTVSGARDISNVVQELVASRSEFARIGNSAQRVWYANQGATKRIFELIVGDKEE